MSAFTKVAYVTSVAGVFVVSVIYLRGDILPTGDIRVTSRLDEYTRASNPNVPNTIPTFLMQPGSTGIDRKSTRLNSSHIQKSRMPSSA